jgi:hypothetical protein
LTQQCNANQLYSTSCSGYQSAYAQKVALETQSKVATAEAPKPDAPPPGSPPPPPPGAPVQDATSTKAEVKMDLGGATISITGEIKPSDDIPDAARPPPQELASAPGSGPSGQANAANPSVPPPPGAPAGFAERQQDVQQDRRTISPVNALSIARNAVAATEAIARSVASESAKMSYSENANPSDGIGLSLDMTGIKMNIPGLTFGSATNSFQQEATNNNSTFYSANNTQMMNNASVVEEPKYTPKQENQNMNQGMEMPVIPHQIASSHFENRQSSITAIQEQRVENNDTVKNKGDVSELAGGIDLSKLTLVPAGYITYMALTIKDSPFYEVKEVYKNQKTTDNVRALRQMSSDRLHQEMINQQYKLGN